MATAQLEYMPSIACNLNYKHKKFGKRMNGICAETRSSSVLNATQAHKIRASATTQQEQQRLFRPYALNENTPRKRRLSAMQAEQQGYQAAARSHLQKPQYSYAQPAQRAQPLNQANQIHPTAMRCQSASPASFSACSITPPPSFTLSPSTPTQPQHYYANYHNNIGFYNTSINLNTSPPLNHRAYAVVLEKQRAVLQMRQLLAINPDANTWPLEWRNALYAMLNN